MVCTGALRDLLRLDAPFFLGIGAMALFEVDFDVACAVLEVANFDVAFKVGVRNLGSCPNFMGWQKMIGTHHQDWHLSDLGMRPSRTMEP